MPPVINIRTRRAVGQAVPASRIATDMAERLVGQQRAIDDIVPYVEMYQAGLSPEDRPAGVFLLLGPTGTGKTRTVEALAEVLHGNPKCVVKINCGEYQLEHEVAKLIGAPPGYLGHKETQPILTQRKLTAASTENCGLSLVLFDEIEKAAPSLARLLLGVLDRGTLQLSDNTTVDFDKTLIFMTSNLGAEEMQREIMTGYGFHRGAGEAIAERKLVSIGTRAMRKKFSPEFINRIDRTITYQPLDAEALCQIVDFEVAGLQRHILRRLDARGFELDVPAGTRAWLVDNGTSAEYGARELKRTVHRHLTQPIAAMVARKQIPAGCTVRAGVSADGERLALKVD